VGLSVSEDECDCAGGMSDQSALDESLEELMVGFLDICQKYMPMIRFVPVPKKMTNSFCRTFVLASVNVG
jgi:hypothetical protein